MGHTRGLIQSMSQPQMKESLIKSLIEETDVMNLIILVKHSLYLVCLLHSKSFNKRPMGHNAHMRKPLENR